MWRVAKVLKERNYRAKEEEKEAVHLLYVYVYKLNTIILYNIVWSNSDAAAFHVSNCANR